MLAQLLEKLVDRAAVELVPTVDRDRRLIRGLLHPCPRPQPAAAATRSITDHSASV